MSAILNFLFGYVAILIFWLIINLFFYALTTISRKGFFFIPFALNTLLNWAIQIYLLFYYAYNYIWKSIISKEWLLLIISLVFGSFLIGFWQFVYGLLVMPISGITVYFSEQATKFLDRKGNEFDYEVISPEGKIIEKNQSLDKSQKMLSLWFIVTFVILFIRQFTTTWSDNSFGPIWFVIIPMFVILTSAIFVGFFVGIFNLIKKRRFFTENRYEYLATTLKIVAIIYGLSFLYELFLR